MWGSASTINHQQSSTTTHELATIGALKILQAVDEIVIVPTDKGRAVVAMDRLDYVSKINTLLSDQLTYQKLTHDPAPALERRMNKLLLSLKRSGAIPPKPYDRLCSSAGKMPLFYGIPKIHKPDVLLQPITSFIHSPSYHRSKHLVW